MSFRMLVGLDDSPFAATAATVSLDLLERLERAELTALHVVNVVAPSGNLLKDLPGRLGFEPAVVSEEVEKEYANAGRALLAELKQRAGERGLEVKTLLDHGAVGERVCHYADQVDLLVLGIRGETEERFPGQGGANVYSIVSEIGVPTLLVSKQAGPLRSVVVGYDGSKAASHALGALRRLAERLPVAVHAVLVDTGSGASAAVLDEVSEQLSDCEVIKHVVRAERVREALLQVARDVDANMIAVGFHGNSPLKDFFMGSASEYLLSEQSIMLLIAH